MAKIEKKMNILLFAPDFFGYYKKIMEALNEKGFYVDVILENFSSNSYLYRFFYIKNDKLKKKYTDKYYYNEISNLQKKYDYVFVIRGEAVSLDHLFLLKKSNPNAIFIMYQWDSVTNNPNALRIERAFDKIFTFDLKDAEKYKWTYRPLFYVGDDDNDKVGKTIDFCFIGTLYYKRAILYKKINEYCLNNKYSLFDYLFCHKLVYYIHKYLLHDKRYSIVEKNKVKFIPLSSDELITKYKNARILVDYAANNQTGLTMRTIESIGYKCKIITNNKSILNEEIYNYGNIYIYDLEHFDIPLEFVKSDYNDLPYELNEYYSLNGWINTIFESEINK